MYKHTNACAHKTCRNVSWHTWKGTLWLRLRFWDVASQNLIMIFHDVVYMWWYNFEEILRNIGASPQTIFYVSGELLPQSFLQFLIDKNQSLISKVMAFLSTALVLTHMVSLLSCLTKTPLSRWGSNIFENGFQWCNLQIMGYKKVQKKTLKIDQKCHKVPFRMSPLIYIYRKSPKISPGRIS